MKPPKIIRLLVRQLNDLYYKIPQKQQRTTLGDEGDGRSVELRDPS